METNASLQGFGKAMKFKSYYVVWKHKRMQKDREKFKSLNRTM